MLSIQAEKRSKTDRLDVLRNNGKIPGVVYGASTPNTSITLDRSVFEKIFKHKLYLLKNKLNFQNRVELYKMCLKMFVFVYKLNIFIK